MNWTNLLLSFVGGVLGAAIGGAPAFVFTGILTLIGVSVAAGGGGRDFLTHVTFGPMLGPHVCFAAGAAAAAYAARRGKHPTGRDIARPLVGLDSIDVLLAGGAFGVLGHLVNTGLTAAGLGPWTDTVALSVFLSGLAARLTCGRTGVFGKVRSGGRRFHPDENACWLRFQEGFAKLVTLGLTLGLCSAALARFLGQDRGGDVLGFGLAAVLLLLLQAGFPCPLWHHVALTAGMAFLLSSNLLVSAAVGLAAALLGELYSRLFLIHGDTYVDPPAAAIATLNTLLRLAAAGGLFTLIPSVPD